MRIWDALSFLFVLTVLGSFTFWVVGYFLLETVRYVLRGPSQQLESVGTSILDEPELVVPRVEPPALPGRAA